MRVEEEGGEVEGGREGGARAFVGGGGGGGRGRTRMMMVVGS